MKIFQQIYFLVQYAVVAVLMVIVLAMILRLIFNFQDPNPFGTIGQFSYWLKKKTDSLVRPVANWLSIARFDTRYAPLVTILLACLVGYFFLQVVGTLAFTFDGVIISVSTGKLVALVGYLLYGFLGLLSLAIFIRIILSWFMTTGNRFTRFLMRFTDPILEPFRRLIPPLGGMIDISPIIVMFLLDLFQRGVAGTLIAGGR